jgi:hypothetical protein
VIIKKIADIIMTTNEIAASQINKDAVPPDKLLSK